MDKMDEQVCQGADEAVFPSLARGPKRESSNKISNALYAGIRGSKTATDHHHLHLVPSARPNGFFVARDPSTTVRGDVIGTWPLLRRNIRQYRRRTLCMCSYPFRFY